MKILVTGSSGMLGGALCRSLSGTFDVIGLDVRRHQHSGVAYLDADITQQENTIHKIVAQKPDIIIHAAAYADVDGCETDSERAQRVNALGTKIMSLAAKNCQALLCYISTDFVFDGEKKEGYIETDTPHPINIYGNSKLEGERYVQSIVKQYVIVRSSWLFGKSGKNFVDTLLSKADGKDSIKVVSDQRGSPTYTEDLAQAIGKLLGCEDALHGIYHITNSGSCTWYEFALAIKEIAGFDAEVVATTSDQYISPTKRPKMSVLENKRYQECTGQRLRYWKEALRQYLDECQTTNR